MLPGRALLVEGFVTTPTYRSLLSDNIAPALWLGAGFGLGATPSEHGFAEALAFAAFCAVWFALIVAALTAGEWGVRRALSEWVPR